MLFKLKGLQPSNTRRTHRQYNIFVLNQYLLYLSASRLQCSAHIPKHWAAPVIHGLKELILVGFLLGSCKVAVTTLAHRWCYSIWTLHCCWFGFDLQPWQNHYFNFPHINPVILYQAQITLIQHSLRYRRLHHTHIKQARILLWWSISFLIVSSTTNVGPSQHCGPGLDTC